MLPYTPLHLLMMLKRVDRSRSCAPAATCPTSPRASMTTEARARLGSGRRLVSRPRPTDSQSGRRFCCSPRSGALVRTMRRARGLAPSGEPLPPGLEGAPALLACGGQFKSVFALSSGRAGGDVSASWGISTTSVRVRGVSSRRSALDGRAVSTSAPAAIVVDRHPEYRATQWGRAKRRDRPTALDRSAAPSRPRGGSDGRTRLCRSMVPPVLGIALDGLGLGDDGAIWGGELLLLATYARSYSSRHFQACTDARRRPRCRGSRGATCMLTCDRRSTTPS